MKNLDLVIIGGGPMGIACAIEAKKNAIDYIILEKDVLVNSIYNFPTNMTFFSTSKLLEIGDVPFISHLSKPTRKEALEYYRRVVESWDLKINLYEAVLGVEKRDTKFEITSSRRKYTCSKIVVATGFYDTPNLLDVPGEKMTKVNHYYQDPHPYVGQKLAIVGAGNSACDAALENYHKGAQVTMIIRKNEIKPSVKYWIKPNIENRINEGSIQAYFESTVSSIQEDHIIISTPDHPILKIPNDFVLAMTGYKPNYPFLSAMGIEFRKDEYQTPECNDASLETNVSGVYIAGVVCGGLKTNRLFIENSREHADMIIKDIINKLENEQRI